MKLVYIFTLVVVSLGCGRPECKMDYECERGESCRNDNCVDLEITTALVNLLPIDDQDESTDDQSGLSGTPGTSTTIDGHFGFFDPSRFSGESAVDRPWLPITNNTPFYFYVLEFTDCGEYVVSGNCTVTNDGPSSYVIHSTTVTAYQYSCNNEPGETGGEDLSSYCSFDGLPPGNYHFSFGRAETTMTIPQPLGINDETFNWVHHNP